MASATDESYVERHGELARDLQRDELGVVQGPAREPAASAPSQRKPIAYNDGGELKRFGLRFRVHGGSRPIAMFDAYLNLLASIVLLSLIFSLLEAPLPAEKGQPAARQLFNLAYVPVFLAFVAFVAAPVLDPLIAGVLTFVDGGILPTVIGPESGLLAHIAFALCFAVVWDVCQYWQHRLQHTVSFLWETHRFHHSETGVNAVTQGRHHVLSYLAAVVFYLPVVILFGVQSPHFVATFLMFRVWGFVNHMNLRLSLGRLTPIISAPQWHRIHHSIQVEHRDKNFATFFPFIDLLFGTYYGPQKNEYPRTGIPSDDGSHSLREATIGPLLAWYSSLRRCLAQSNPKGKSLHDQGETLRAPQGSPRRVSPAHHETTGRSRRSHLRTGRRRSLARPPFRMLDREGDDQCVADLRPRDERRIEERDDRKPWRAKPLGDD